MNNVWKNTDPRYDINKRDDIVILRPSLSGHWEAGIGHVDTKNGWDIFTNFENRSFISADDEWDEMWQWTFAPKRLI